MTDGPVVEFAIFSAMVMAACVWCAWSAWKAYGREDLLRRITRRCEIHDQPDRHRIRQLEAELGLTQGLLGREADACYAIPILLDCGHSWCRTRSED